MADSRADIPQRKRSPSGEDDSDSGKLPGRGGSGAPNEGGAEIPNRPLLFLSQSEGAQRGDVKRQGVASQAPDYHGDHKRIC